MTETSYIAGFIAVTAIATFITRVTPFLFLSRHSDHPLLQHLGQLLPAAVMTLLVVIFLQRSADWGSPLFGLDALAPAALVIVLHLWKQHALLSIMAGTICYMMIQQL